MEEFICGYNIQQYANVEKYYDSFIERLSNSKNILTIKQESERMRLSALNECVYASDVTPYSSGGRWYYNCFDLIRDNAYGKYDILGSSRSRKEALLPYQYCLPPLSPCSTRAPVQLQPE